MTRHYPTFPHLRFNNERKKKKTGGFANEHLSGQVSSVISLIGHNYRMQRIDIEDQIPTRSYLLFIGTIPTEFIRTILSLKKKKKQYNRINSSGIKNK